MNTVKLQAEGYLVDGKLSVPNDPGNRHWQAVQEWIAEGNTPEPEFTQIEIDANAQVAVNQEAREYLASTDWQLLRELDGGAAMTVEVKQARADARLRVVKRKAVLAQDTQ